MLRKSVVLLLAGLLLLAACAAPASEPAAPAAPAAESTQPAPAATSPAQAPAATSPAATTAPAATTQPAAVVPTQPAIAAPTAAAAAGAQTAVSTASPAGSSSAAAMILTLVPEGTEARFRVKEQFANRSLPNDAVGTTKAVTGQIVIQPDGLLVPGQSKITVDVSTLKSDEGRRDNYIKTNTLQTSQYPTATFVPTAIQGLPSPLPTSGDVNFQITGDMTVHGVTKPATWQAKGTISGQELKGTATQAFKFSDFNMSIPRVAMILSVEDNIRLELDFHLVKQS